MAIRCQTNFKSPIAHLNERGFITIEALNRAYQLLQHAAFELYLASDKAVETGEDSQAELLRVQADRIFEQASNLEVLIAELSDENS